jgi:hypothetical protein
VGFEKSFSAEQVSKMCTPTFYFPSLIFACRMCLLNSLYIIPCRSYLFYEKKKDGKDCFQLDDFCCYWMIEIWAWDALYLLHLAEIRGQGNNPVPDTITVIISFCSKVGFVCVCFVLFFRCFYFCFFFCCFFFHLF